MNSLAKNKHFEKKNCQKNKKKFFRKFEKIKIKISLNGHNSKTKHQGPLKVG